MTAVDRSRFEIKQIAHARLEIEEQKVQQEAREKLRALPPLQLPKALKKELADLEKLRKDIEAREAVLIETAKAAGFYWNGYRNPLQEKHFLEADNSDRQKAITEERDARTKVLREAYVNLQESMALAFSPAEFREAFEKFVKAIKS